MTLDVTADEINIIGAGLGKLPYEVVAQLIAKLNEQIKAQEQPKG